MRPDADRRTVLVTLVASLVVVLAVAGWVLHSVTREPPAPPARVGVA